MKCKLVDKNNKVVLNFELTPHCIETPRVMIYGKPVQKIYVLGQTGNGYIYKEQTHIHIKQ